MSTGQERQRLREPEAARELDDDEMLDAVNALMRQSPKYRAAMQELIDELLVTKGESVAINMGLDIREALED